MKINRRAAHEWILMLVALVMLGLYLTETRAQIPREAQTYQREYTRIVRGEWGLDAPIASLAAQIAQESSWNCNAVSRVGARSCSQFMPTTALWINEMAPRLKADDIYSPAWAFRAQAVYMKWLREKIKAADECERMAFAMSGYNGGLGYVYRRQKLSARPGICFGVTCEINPGILPANQRENAEYPVRILRKFQPKYELWGLGAC